MSKYSRWAKRQRRRSEHMDCIGDLLENARVQEMNNYPQHRGTNCYRHCMNVSYIGFLMARSLRLNYSAAARGGMLHDMCLYDWHTDDSGEGMHAWAHPKMALRNARECFDLSSVEQDIIYKHMWPLSPVPPKYIEGFIITIADKLCAVMEFVGKNVTA